MLASNIFLEKMYLPSWHTFSRRRPDFWKSAPFVGERSVRGRGGVTKGLTEDQFLDSFPHRSVRHLLVIIA